MQSGCGGGLYGKLDVEFLNKLKEYYAQVIKYSLTRGIISDKYLKEFGPAAYAGMSHCFQLCNGLLIRETGQLMRCPGADHQEWQDSISSKELLNNGICWAWPKTRNYNENSYVNVGCLAKPNIFTEEFKNEILELVKLKF
jgi:hypothetical protein